MTSFGTTRADIDTLKQRAIRIRAEHPDKFTVRKLKEELGCSNHLSSRIYNNILRSGAID